MADSPVLGFTEVTNPTGDDLFYMVDNPGASPSDAKVQGKNLNRAAMQYGTSFPGTPAANDLCFRTDRGLLYYYDGTRWLSVNLYREPFGYPQNLQPFSANAIPGRSMAWLDPYDIYLINYQTLMFVSTTNSGTAYWTCALEKVDSSNTRTVVATASTQSLSPNTWLSSVIAVNTVMPAGTYVDFNLIATKVSTPGTLNMQAMITYRLVG